MSEMQRGSDVRTSEYPIDTVFLDRWSPRAMSGDWLWMAERTPQLSASKPMSGCV